MTKVQITAALDRERHEHGITKVAHVKASDSWYFASQRAQRAEGQLARVLRTLERMADAVLPDGTQCPCATCTLIRDSAAFQRCVGHD